MDSWLNCQASVGYVSGDVLRIGVFHVAICRSRHQPRNRHNPPEPSATPAETAAPVLPCPEIALNEGQPSSLGWVLAWLFCPLSCSQQQELRAVFMRKEMYMYFTMYLEQPKNPQLPAPLNRYSSRAAGFTCPKAAMSIEAGLGLAGGCNVCEAFQLCLGCSWGGWMSGRRGTFLKCYAICWFDESIGMQVGDAEDAGSEMPVEAS